jgi:hypothetical protein
MRDTQKFLYGIRLLIWYKSGAYLLPDAEPPTTIGLITGLYSVGIMKTERVKR